MLDEFLALAYHKERKLPVVIFRLFNTVGPKQSGRYGMAIPRFVANALENKPITIHGDGNQTRCFAHVSDVVEALTSLADTPEAIGQAYNLGSDKRVTINELVSLVKKTLGSSSSVTHVPYADVYGPDFEDIRHRVPDISKITKLINYQPVHDLRKIIQDVAENIRRKGGAGQHSEVNNE
jgi:UDP-glucose 4-epimerase